MQVVMFLIVGIVLGYVGYKSHFDLMSSLKESGVETNIFKLLKNI